MDGLIANTLFLTCECGLFVFHSGAQRTYVLMSTMYNVFYEYQITLFYSFLNISFHIHTGHINQTYLLDFRATIKSSRELFVQTKFKVQKPNFRCQELGILCGLRVSIQIFTLTNGMYISNIVKLPLYFCLCVIFFVQNDNVYCYLNASMQVNHVLLYFAVLSC